MVSKTNKTDLNLLEQEERVYRDNKGQSKKKRSPYKRQKSQNWLDSIEEELEEENYVDE
jgi:hypothetical protein